MYCALGGANEEGESGRAPRSCVFREKDVPESTACFFCFNGVDFYKRSGKDKKISLWEDESKSGQNEEK